MSNLDLKKIIAPVLSQSNYGANIKEKFEDIDDNFRILGNHEYLKGDTGKCIHPENLQIVFEVEGERYFTPDGIFILNKMFSKFEEWQALPEDNTKISDVKAAIESNTCAVEAIKSINGVSVLDFFTEGAVEDIPVFIALYEYDPNVYDPNDSLTQDKKSLVSVTNYVVFKDYRFVKAMENLSEEDLEKFSDKVDMSCSIYGSVVESMGLLIPSFGIMQNFPTLYYDSELKSFCWNFVGTKTGIIAQGPQGPAGISGAMKICCSEVQVQYTGPNSYVISKYHDAYKMDPDNPTFFNVDVDSTNVPTGTNCVLLLSVADGVTPEDNDETYTWAFIGNAYPIVDEHGEEHMAIWCSPANCLQDNVTANQFLNVMLGIDYSGNTTELEGLFIPFKPNDDSEPVHMLYATKEKEQSSSDDLFRELHLGPMMFGSTKYTDDAYLTVDYKKSKFEGDVILNGYKEVESGNIVRRGDYEYGVMVNDKSLFNDYLYVRGAGKQYEKETEEGKPVFIEKTYPAMLIVGDQVSYSDPDDPSAKVSSPGYIGIKSSGTQSDINYGRLYVDVISPYSALDNDAPESPLILIGSGSHNEVYVGTDATSNSTNFIVTGDFEVGGASALRGGTPRHSNFYGDLTSWGTIYGHGITSIGEHIFDPSVIVKSSIPSNGITICDRFIQREDLNLSNLSSGETKTRDYVRWTVSQPSGQAYSEYFRNSDRDQSVVLIKYNGVMSTPWQQTGHNQITGTNVYDTVSNVAGSFLQSNTAANQCIVNITDTIYSRTYGMATGYTNYNITELTIPSLKIYISRRSGSKAKDTSGQEKFRKVTGHGTVTFSIWLSNGNSFNKLDWEEVYQFDLNEYTTAVSDSGYITTTNGQTITTPAITLNSQQISDIPDLTQPLASGKMIKVEAKIDVSAWFTEGYRSISLVERSRKLALTASKTTGTMGGIKYTFNNGSGNWYGAKLLADGIVFAGGSCISVLKMPRGNELYPELYRMYIDSGTPTWERVSWENATEPQVFGTSSIDSSDDSQTNSSGATLLHPSLGDILANTNGNIFEHKDFSNMRPVINP